MKETRERLWVNGLGHTYECDRPTESWLERTEYIRADLAGLPEELALKAQNAIRAWDNIDDRYTRLDLAAALSEILRWSEELKS